MGKEIKSIKIKRCKSLHLLYVNQVKTTQFLYSCQHSFSLYVKPDLIIMLLKILYQLTVISMHLWSSSQFAHHRKVTHIIAAFFCMSHYSSCLAIQATDSLLNIINIRSAFQVFWFINESVKPAISQDDMNTGEVTGYTSTSHFIRSSKLAVPCWRCTLYLSCSCALRPESNSCLDILGRWSLSDK